MSRDHQDTACSGTSDLVRWRIYWHPPKRMCRIRRCFGPKRSRQADVLVSGVYGRALRLGTFLSWCAAAAVHKRGSRCIVEAGGKTGDVPDRGFAAAARRLRRGSAR